MEVKKTRKYCRWGVIETENEVSPGIKFVSTPSHGGYILSKALNDAIPDYIRSEDKSYEEDCAWSIVACCFPFITNRADQVEHAHATMKNWYPDEYSSLFHTTVLPSESIERRRQLFERENKNNFVVTSAFGDWHKNVPPGHVGVLAQRQNEKRWFMVTKQEYNTRDNQPFVIDLDKHTEVEDFHN
jgi:hypothetical protein